MRKRFVYKVTLGIEDADNVCDQNGLLGSEIRDWLIEHVGPSWHYVEYRPVPSWRVSGPIYFSCELDFHFRCASDAVHFKMRWYGA